MQQVCVGPYAIETISGESEIEEYYSARPFTVGEGWTQVNKLLFGNTKSAPSNEKVRYAYEPELVWTEWQENYLKGEEAGDIQDWSKVMLKEGIGAPLAIVEYSGQNRWWQPKKYIGTHLPMIQSVSAQPEIDIAAIVDEDAEAISIIKNKLNASLKHEVDTQIVRYWREAFCILGSLSYNRGLVGLAAAYGEMEPYKIFILNSEDAEQKG